MAKASANRLIQDPHRGLSLVLRTSFHNAMVKALLDDQWLTIIIEHRHAEETNASAPVEARALLQNTVVMFRVHLIVNSTPRIDLRQAADDIKGDEDRPPTTRGAGRCSKVLRRVPESQFLGWRPSGYGGGAHRSMGRRPFFPQGGFPCLCSVSLQEKGDVRLDRGPPYSRLSLNHVWG